MFKRKPAPATLHVRCADCNHSWSIAMTLNATDLWCPSCQSVAVVLGGGPVPLGYPGAAPDAQHPLDVISQPPLMFVHRPVAPLMLRDTDMDDATRAAIKRAIGEVDQ